MDFGSRLREARERRGISLRQIAAHTRISLPSLQALENNEIGKLPGGIFSRAFVRSYAHEVGLDPDETVREFVSQFPLDHVTAGTPSSRDGDLLSGEEDVRRRRAYGVALTLAVALPLGALLVYLMLSSRDPVSASAGSVDPSNPTATPPTDGTDPGVSAGAGAPGTAAARPASSAPAGSAAAGAKPAAAPGSLGISPSAPSYVKPDPRAAASAATNAAASPGTSAGTVAAPNAVAALNPAEPLRLSIVADGPCWVRIVSDGQMRREVLLEKGDVVTQEARDGFELLVGDAATFRFSVNGRPGRRLGASGEVVSARITRDSLGQWLQQTTPAPPPR